MIDQRIRTPFRALAAAVAVATSVALTAAQPASAQPLPPTPPSVPSPQVTRTNLTIRSTAPADVAIGQQFDYRFSVYRYYQFGPATSQRVTIRHTAPPGLTFINQNPAPGFTCNHSSSNAGNVLVCTGTMTATAPGSTQTANFSVRYKAPSALLEGGNYVLRATVDPDNAISETNEGDNVADSTVRIPDWF